MLSRDSGMECNMNDELAQIDADLKGLLMEDKIEEMNELLKEQPDSVIKEISECNWNIVKKYYETECFELLFRHFTFVAYTCFLIEYEYREGLINNEIYETTMGIFNALYDKRRQQ
jgi:hypothetical protein